MRSFEVMNFISLETTIAQCSQGLQQCQGEIMLHPGDEGQKPKTVVLGLHLLSFGTAHLIFHGIYIIILPVLCSSSLYYRKIGSIMTSRSI